ncbi:hypothetical protein COCON_G00155490 [Conger conger]|uniref:Uncharacterized protein n=1 Tax=Conger conger TaxID=82655 RepID=A0A9Q1HT45_CONCO|nr:hypothetical protein COCON_G00155490 [Conger conger]
MPLCLCEELMLPMDLQLSQWSRRKCGGGRTAKKGNKKTAHLNYCGVSANSEEFIVKSERISPKTESSIHRFCCPKTRFTLTGVCSYPEEWKPPEEADLFSVST